MNEKQIKTILSVRPADTKTLPSYQYLQDLSIEQSSKIYELEHNWNELKKWLEDEIYKIEPKGTAINYNCEYDSEEDYINAMKERSKLITLKRVLIMLQELERGKE